jgi:hypothetical protein
VHDHAIVVLLAGAALVLIVGTIIIVSLPSRGHMLRTTFAALSWIALLLGCGVMLSAYGLVPGLGIAGPEALTAGMGAALLVMVALLWRVGSWWAAHLEAERDKLAKDLKAANAPITLTVSGQKAPAGRGGQAS